MKYLELIESAYAPLYHSIDKMRYAVTALKNNEIAATSTQRFWADGKRRKDNDPEYKESFWMKGVSTTRDIDYAKQWGHFLFILDQNILRQRYKIIPFNWGFSIPTGNHHKREREEFIVKKSTWDTYMHSPYDYDPTITQFDINRFQEPEGSIKPLNLFLKGIMVSNIMVEIYKNEIDPIIIKHPKFIGYYNSKK